jgi:3-oxoacyl-[acyl-carrier protein] reductase
VRVETEAMGVAPTPATRRRVALVTGSSRGQGRAIARRLARDGLAVAVNDVHASALALDVVGAIQDDGGVAHAFTADVTDERQVADLVAAVAGSLGPVDVLVLNATGPQPEAPLADVAWEDHIAQLEFFVKSPVLLARTVLPGMQARRFGRIVQIDSEVVDRPPPGQVCLRRREERPDRSHPRLGARARPSRHHREYGRARLHPRRAPRARSGRDQTRLPRLRARRPHGDSRGHRPRGQLLRLGGGRFVTGQRLVVDGGRGLGD